MSSRSIGKISKEAPLANRSSGVADESENQKREKQMIEIRKYKEEKLLKKLLQPFETADPDFEYNVKMDNLYQVAGVWSDDEKWQLESMTYFRKVLSQESKPTVDLLIEVGVVPYFVEFLTRDDLPKLQFEAAWVLTNMASGTSEHTQVVIDFGAVPIYVRLLSSTNGDICEQAVWALGNISGNSPKCRDLVLSQGAMDPLLELLNKEAKLARLRNGAWTLSNLCHGKPKPPFEQVKPALRVLRRLVRLNDEEMLIDVCWALSYLSEGTDDNIQAVIEAGVCPRIVELLLHPSVSVLLPALRTVGNIVTGDDLQTQCVIDHGALPRLLSIVTGDYKKTIKKEACWIISNITAGNKEQIQAVIDAQLIGPLVSLLQTAEFDIKKEAAWAIFYATSGGTHDQIKCLVNEKCVKPLCDLLECRDPKIIYVCLKGIENIFKAGEAEKNKAGNVVNHYAQLIYEAGGLDKIENLQTHDNDEIYEKAVQISESYDNADDDDQQDDEALIPASAGGSFKFSG